MRHVPTLVLLAACEAAGPAPGSALSTIPTDGSVASSPSATGSDPAPAPGEEPAPAGDDVVRFVALGDAGEGNEAQYAVAEAIEGICAQRGCDFALYLGDNFYDSGVDGVDDAQWQTKFEDPYADLAFPFFPVLGNHDLGLGGLGLDFFKADTYVEYTQYSTKWTMPDRFYRFEWGPVRFYALDTTRIFYALGDDQEEWLDAELAASTATWNVVFGHHPYVSNGAHGNAGEYDGIDPWIPLTEIPRGQYVKEFVEDVVCGRADLYLAGHDHTLQWLEPTCGTEFIVSGAGAKLTGLEGRGTPTFYETDAVEGFLWGEFDGDRFSGAFYDREGNELFSMSYTR